VRPGTVILNGRAQLKSLLGKDACEMLLTGLLQTEREKPCLEGEAGLFYAMARRALPKAAVSVSHVPAGESGPVGMTDRAPVS
jgi:hypothetical protein